MGKFLRGFPTDDGVIAPQVKVVSLYMDQISGFQSPLPCDRSSLTHPCLCPASQPVSRGACVNCTWPTWPVEIIVRLLTVCTLSGGCLRSGLNEGFRLGDLGAFMARKHGLRVCQSIREALCCGTNTLAVDGVLLIGEHGDYPENELGQQMYPRRHFFEQASAVMAASGRSVPVFIDKYLAASWEDARWMYDRAKQLQIPFMAGSSVPMCFWRNTLDGRGYPEAEHPLGVELEDAVLLSYGGLEAYGYHGLGACSIAACMRACMQSSGY